uniref:Nuclear mitotic apparatus protein 1 n=1 Tax=Plectus sambesii TaxID=2011161 RepID=A0A914W0X8_9BILA
LEEARTETNQALQKLSTVEHELLETKKKYREQEEELHRKSNLLHIVEAAKNKLEGVIKDLQAEVKALKNKVEFLEKERANLQSQSESQAKLQNSQVHALEAVLESVTKEKETTKEHYEHLMEQERAQADERELAMKKEFGNKLNEIEEQYNGLRDHFDTNLVDERITVRKQKVEEDYERRIAALHADNESLEAEVTSLRSKLHVLLSGHELPSSHSFKEQTETMDRQSRPQQEALMTDLIAKSGRLNRELEEARVHLDEKQQTIRDLQDKCRNCNLHDERHKDELDAIKDQLRAELATEISQNSATSNADDMQVAEFKNEIALLREQIAELEKAEDASSSKQADELQETITSLNATIEQLNARIESLESANGSEENSEVQAKLNSAQSELTQRTTEHEAKVNQLLEEIETKQKRIDALEVREVELREEIERELRSKFAEAAAENHVADVEGFEKQLQDYKEHADAKEKEQGERIHLLTEECGAKDKQIEALHGRVKTLMTEVGNIQMELEKKSNELRNFGKKTDDKREQQQTHALEKKIQNLQAEHDQALSHLQQREKELEEQLNSLKEEKSKPVQSEEVQTVDAPEEQQPSAQQLTELEQQLKEKDELIEKLRRDLVEHCCEPPEVEDTSEGRRKDRSQSLAVVGDDKFRRRAANKFQCLVNQMTKGPDKKTTSKSVEKLNVVNPQPAAAKPPPTPSSRDKSPAAARSKSPSLLTRLRDRSPNKARSPAISEQSAASSSKNLLSPTDAERPASVIEERRRSSPARPLFSRTKQAGSEKRPAWKV